LNEVENGLHFIKKNGIIAPESLAAAEELRRAASNLLFGLMRSLRSKLADKGNWQRGLISEESAGYAPTTWAGPKFQVPDSNFPGSDQVPSSKFPDPEGYHG
jgi:hypothetical protein